ncbi:TonB-dependent receptor [Aquisalinus flavus]|uniref:TonB-dependent receptor n=2 Tax=Aquisalinus flavus TaxID=1526572 RepID=A0A8J2V1F9_9PROT|nr:TonB-dependent receptor [Aquisalinus flavus]
MGAFSPMAMAQDDDQAEGDDVIVVTGIRASLERAMDIKRNSDGVVDAISAEDIGKFPDTNLAESLQRITGVSIDRVNGEGSAVTVRGFGPGFNLITLNGRTLPTAEVGVIGARGNYNGGGSRSFDFSNLASEGVSSLEVYKTGQAVLPTGGIGATVNINTRRPLDGNGTMATVQGKLINDTSVDDGDELTPELSGLVNWVNDTGNFGIGLFGSYSRRDSGAPTQQVNDWLVFDPTLGDSPLSSNGSYVRNPGTTPVGNPPAADQAYAIAQDSRYDFSDITRERINGQLVAQFRPIETLSLTADYTFAVNESDELRYEQTNWFATPMDELIFNSDAVAAAVYAYEFNGGTKDIGFEQTNRATKDTLNSFGFNADWELNERMSVVLDAHTSKGESGGNNPLGHLATFTGIGAPVIQEHSVDYRSGYPIQTYTIDDSQRGNGNGVLDAGDVASQVFRSTSTAMEHEVDELDLRFVWDFDNSSLTVGTNYRDTVMTVDTLNTQQDLGSWGLAFPGDVEQYAPGLLEEYCLSCKFDDLPVGQAETAFKADAVDLWNALVPIYEAMTPPADNPNRFRINQTPGFDEVEETIFSMFAQFAMEAELLDRPARISAGIRYEETEVSSATVQAVPSGFNWQADNDFLVEQTGDTQNVSGDGSYDHLLPNVDFQMDVRDDVVLRASYSKTIGRPSYTNLYASVGAAAPNRPTVLGGQLTGTSQNPGLLPLESDNFDVSLEWYYDDTSYISAGYFKKDTKNFVGTGVVERNLFGIRDQTAGGAGSRSGEALAIIQELGADQSEANLFTLTALIDNRASVAAARAEFEANLDGGTLPQGYVDDILAAFDVRSDSNDPLAVYSVEQPLNADEGVIDGWELAWQHFFGDTGFGLQANYTIVDGDITADPAAPKNINQFALIGLSDTANFTAIYENYGWSARLAYNWRDTFLSATNEGGDRSAIYTEDYGQFDFSVNYDVTEQLAVSFEGINITGEDQRQYHRYPDQFWYGYELSPRYVVGARYNF